MTASTTSKQYGSLFWAGLPVSLSIFDPLHIEFDINYGYSEAMGRYDVLKRGEETVRASTGRQGWLAKALVEYKMDWATPGLFGWYASGDDSSVKNGSERMPSLVPTGNFTSYMGDGNMGWLRQDYGVDYSGTWGIGAQLKDMSFLEDLKHTFRVNLIGGTNSPSMAKKLSNNGIAANGMGLAGGATEALGMDPLYMTSMDYAMEIGLTNTYKMYDNFTIMLDAAYLATWLDQSRSVWGTSKMNGKSDEVRDPWNVNVSFVYSF